MRHARMVPLLLATTAAIAGDTEPKHEEIEVPAAIRETFPVGGDAMPRLDSSTSAQPLAMLVSCAARGVPAEWVGGFAGERWLSVAERVRRNRAAPMGALAATSGTHGAYTSLIRGGTRDGPADADLILVARAPSEDELAAAGQAGVELDARPVARDALVFIVNGDNKLEGLTLDQARDIYTGKVTNWEEVGGEDAAIHAYQRDRNSGSQELMEKLVMKGREMIEPKAMMMLRGMAGPINRVSGDRHGLGYTVYFYERHMAPTDRSPPEWALHRPGRRTLAIDRVEPTPQTIASGEYPLTTPVYVVIRKGGDADDPAVKVRDWLLSEAGQKLVALSGYVPIKPAAERDEP